VGLAESSADVNQAKEILKKITEEEKVVGEVEKALQSGACVKMDHSTIIAETLEGIFYLCIYLFIYFYICQKNKIK